MLLFHRVLIINAADQSFIVLNTHHTKEGRGICADLQVCSGIGSCTGTRPENILWVIGKMARKIDLLKIDVAMGSELVRSALLGV